MIGRAIHPWAVFTFACLSLTAACSSRTDLLPSEDPLDAGGTGDGGTIGPSDSGSTRDANTPIDDASSEPTDAGGARDGGSDAGGNPGNSGDLLYIKASNPDAQDWFGYDIALSDRWLAVGARNESSWASGLDGDQADDSEDRSGAVYLFSNEESGWKQRHYIKASNPGAGDSFGAVLALHGATLAVGAPHEDSPATGIDGDQGNGGSGNHGAVYIFTEEDGAWRQEAYVKSSNIDGIDLFGSGVALEGDTLVVGAPYEDSAAGIDGDQADNSVQNCGAAYVFERTAAGWEQTAYLKASDPEPNDEFGTSVAISGTTIAVGAYGESMNAGAVYVFERDGASYRQTAVVKASNAAPESSFGWSIALHGDTLAVGATGFASSPTRMQSGAAYVFERSSDGWSQTAFLEASSPIEQTYFGLSVALHADTLLVGATGDGHPEEPRAGAAYVFARGTSGWSLRDRVLAPNAELNDNFGSGLAIDGAYVAISATGEASSSAGIDGDSSNNAVPGAGAVFLYAR